MLGEEKVATNSLAASFGLGEVGAITVIVQDHVAGVIANDGIRMRCCIVQEVDNGGKSGLGGFGLGGGNGTNSDQHSRIKNSNSII
jgi:hypothetical protein